MPSVGRRDRLQQTPANRAMDQFKMFPASHAGPRLSGAIASRMVPQHACAVAGSTGVDWSLARATTKSAGFVEEAFEVRGGKLHLAWLDHSFDFEVFYSADQW